MNLDLPSFLPDSEMSFDILARPGSSVLVIDNFYLDLKLVGIQSDIIKNIKKEESLAQQRQAIDSILAKMNDMWRLKI